MEFDIGVSIICNTYNHEKYIRKALEGFLMQKTDFAYEVLVHDDASTDSTAEIIGEYEAKYPDIIKPIYETENQYSQHNGMISKLQYGRVQGKYIAICEGDDYWIDPLKLQKQFDAMEKHPELDICAHKSIVVDETGEKTIREIAPKEKTCVIPFEEVILEGNWYVYLATASFFYRASINKDIPRFRSYLPLDYTVKAHGALRGGLLYLNDCMSAYRYQAIGSWTTRMAVADVQSKNAFFEKKQRMLDYMDEDTNRKYTKAINERKLRNEFVHLQSANRYKDALASKYAFILNNLSAKERTKIWIKAYFPWTYKLKRKLIKQ